MPYRFFRIPAHFATEEEQQLNSFIESHRTLAINKRFVDIGANSYWAICVEFYQATSNMPNSSKKARIDYREVLNAEQFAVFVRLRDFRQIIAKEESVPVYTIFTNEQLAAMVTSHVNSLSELGKIDGIGEARLAKYGTRFLDCLQLPKS